MQGLCHGASGARSGAYPRWSLTFKDPGDTACVAPGGSRSCEVRRGRIAGCNLLPVAGTAAGLRSPMNVARFPHPLLTSIVTSTSNLIPAGVSSTN